MKLEEQYILMMTRINELERELAKVTELLLKEQQLNKRLRERMGLSE